MKIQITAGGIYDGKGEEIAIGTEFDVENEPTAWAGRYTVLSDKKADKVEKPQTAPVVKPVAVVEPAIFVAPVGPFTARESSPGWWGIFDGTDQPVGKKARKADLDGFDTLSDEDKLAFATAHAQTSFDAAQAKA